VALAVVGQRQILVLAFFSGLTWGKPIPIAALYSKGKINYSNATPGPAAICITEAVVKEAKKTGINLSLTVIDPKWNPIDAAIAAERVIKEGYRAVVGTILSGEALVTSDLLNRSQIPFITPTATHPSVTQNRPYSLRIVFNDNLQARLLAKFTQTNLMPKSIAVIRNASNPYSDYVAKTYSQRMKEQGPQIPLHDFPILEHYHEFPQLVARVLAKKPDVLFAPLGESQIASLYTALVEAKAKLTLLTGDSIEGNAEFLRLLTPLSPEIRLIYSNYWNGRLPGSNGARYLQLLKKYCPGEAPSRVSVFAFDAINLLVETLKLHPLGSAKDLMADLRRSKYIGASGPLKYGTDGDPVRPINLFTISKGPPVYWGRYE
jgi:branched-chain amino acid transport system substrate-binding protein